MHEKFLPQNTYRLYGVDIDDSKLGIGIDDL